MKTDEPEQYVLCKRVEKYLSDPNIFPYDSTYVYMPVDISEQAEHKTLLADHARVLEVLKAARFAREWGGVITRLAKALDACSDIPTEVEKGNANEQTHTSNEKG